MCHAAKIVLRRGQNFSTQNLRKNGKATIVLVAVKDLSEQNCPLLIDRSPSHHNLYVAFGPFNIFACESVWDIHKRP